MIDPRVKTQAKHKNYYSRALKWGTVNLCSSISIGNMIKNKKCQFFNFIVTPKVFKLQIHKIPHFKALEE